MTVRGYPIYCLERSEVPLEIQLNLDGKVLEEEIVFDGSTFENYKIKASLGNAALQPVLIQVKLVDEKELAALAAAGTPPFYITDDWLQFLEDEDRRAGGKGEARAAAVQPKTIATPGSAPAPPIDIKALHAWASNSTVFTKATLFFDENIDGKGKEIEIETSSFYSAADQGTQRGEKVYWPVEARIKWKNAAGEYSRVLGNYFVSADSTAPGGWTLALQVSPDVEGILDAALAAAAVSAAVGSSPVTDQEAMSHRLKARVFFLGIDDDETPREKIEISPDEQFEVLGDRVENPLDGTVSWQVTAAIRWHEDDKGEGNDEEGDGEEFSPTPATYTVLNQAGGEDLQPRLTVDIGGLQATDEGLAEKLNRPHAETG